MESECGNSVSTSVCSDFSEDESFCNPFASKRLSEAVGEQYFAVQYSREHSVRQALNGVLAVTSDIKVFDINGCLLHCGPLSDSLVFKAGATLQISSLCLTLQRRLKASEFKSERCFIKAQPFTYLKLPKGALVLDGKHGLYVDSTLATKLRPHQVHGIQFMYKCLSGAVTPKVQGCILADGLGLGKTVQTLGLLSALLRIGRNTQPFATQAVIVVPSSLVLHWHSEAKRWLETGQLSITVCSGTKKQVSAQIQHHKFFKKQLLIVSYDVFRRHDEVLNQCCDLIVCDEGHRIKNSDTKLAKTLNRLTTKKRILLTGTPLQNNLREFYVCVSFANPGILGTPQDFRACYEKPICDAEQHYASNLVKQIALERLRQLLTITSQFVLRRTGSLLEDLLPPRHEYHVFLQPTDLQRQLYATAVTSRTTLNIIEKVDHESVFGLISYLQKITDHPELLRTGKGTNFSKLKEQLLANLPEDQTARHHHSAKLLFIQDLLEKGLACGDKFIVVSRYTAALDLIEEFLATLQCACLRLDGRTKLAVRMDVVRAFNNASQQKVLLLSSKAGGQGLNLVGANRMILLDGDWNPATDRQTMGRVWRDGQTKPVHIYRLFLTGTIDEKIFQRQHHKEDLSCLVIEGTQAVRRFSRTVLKELFSLNDSCQSYTAGADPANLEGSLLSNHPWLDLVVEKEEENRENIREEPLTFSASPLKRRFSPDIYRRS